MSDARAWETSTKPARMLDLHPPGRGRKARLLLVACCRAAWEQLEEVHRQAIELVERFEPPTNEELLAALRPFGIRSIAEPLPLGSGIYVSRFRSILLMLMDRAVSSVLLGVWHPDAVNIPTPAVACVLIRDIFGNPFRPVAFEPAWRTDTAVILARQMYDSREFGAMPILADALQDAGCENEQVLNHCRDPHALHCRGCWVVDLVLGLS